MSDATSWVGLDEDAKRIVVGWYYDSEEQPRTGFEVPFTDTGLRMLLKRLKQMPGTVRCVYEAGGSGYEIYRYLRSKRIDCAVAAPSLTPRRPGDRVKTNRRDAIKLASLHRGKNLTLISVPDEKREALRDLLRAREDAQEDLLRCRNRLLKFLQRQGRRYEEGHRWTRAYWRWLKRMKFEDANQQLVLNEYLHSLQLRAEQLSRFDQAIEDVAKESAYASTVKRLMVFRGVGVLTGMAIIGELGDLRRFRKASQLMAAIGLVSKENSTGDRERRGGITKAGNAHVRYLLVEASWQARHRPSAGGAVAKRRADQPPEIVEIARKADHRLHRKYMRLVHRGKRTTVAAVAVARELAGFIWAVGQVPD